MSTPVEFVASPTMSEFMLSDARIRVLAGPVGGGKSVCCVHELMRVAQCQTPNDRGERLTRFLVVRNTADQLRSTTLKTIKDWFPAPGPFGEWVATERTIYYQFGMPDGTIVKSEWMLRALDDEADIRNALSLEVTMVWGNECRELHPDVVSALLDRTNRYPSLKVSGAHATRDGAIFDTNMPGQDTYWEEVMNNPTEGWSIHIQPPAVLPIETWVDIYQQDPPEEFTATAPYGKVYVLNPLADNIDNLSPTYYPNSVRAKRKEDDLNVYLRCKFGRTMSGLPVYDETFQEAHISPTPLAAISSERYPLVIGIDFGRTPAALFMQGRPDGRVFVLDELCEENMGMKTFATKHLKPLLNERFPGVPFYVAPDPAGWIKGQGEDKAPVDYLEEAGFHVIKPPTNKVGMRIEAAEALLSDSVDGVPRVQIDKRCTNLIAGFRGRYKWAVDKKTGEMGNEREPVKNHPYSDIHDCFQYGALLIDGGHSGRRKSSARREIRLARAAGWT